MRSVAVRQLGHLRNKRLTLVSVVVGLALVATVLALIAVRTHAQRRDLAKPLVHQTQAERERRMAWTEVGAAADPPPAGPIVATHSNQSLPSDAVSVNLEPPPR